MSRYRAGIASLPLLSRLSCVAPWNIPFSHLYPLFTTYDHYIEKSKGGQARKWDFSLRDKELAQLVNAE
jgi:hypothetical protein